METHKWDFLTFVPELLYKDVGTSIVVINVIDFPPCWENVSSVALFV